MLGTGSIVLIGTAALILFGPKKLPELGRSIGSTLREFRQSAKELVDDEENEKK
ncbi:twin-arginine translocase TatA/TatE family subunit [Peribacillus tepidiphilus]|jgi:sec-independent protein translocase protein TatA|uniref:twin-arginine translocase TatA/TatE family subunit n=1 Tax=Peribacillus tepidiphilus TaxID=2652445 RepID=UPI0012916782|nr:twin-arginine translocase TatA/TatE family subunit [Peribacillus tepidiphilus]